MRVIFLDWDGVLCTEATYKARPDRDFNPPFCPDCVARFGRLLDVTGATVVLSTSWRSIGSVACGAYLRGAGIHADLVGCTPWYHNAPRRTEIRTWLAGAEDAYVQAAIPRVTSYVVIDDADDADLLDGRFVQTSMPTGLTDEHVGRAIEILNRPIRPRA